MIEAVVVIRAIRLIGVVRITKVRSTVQLKTADRAYFRRTHPRRIGVMLPHTAVGLTFS